ncbi:hypothetical protein CLV35_1978 [Motilibacter peucedani]|uniref:Uncharacterized protein n=1 Tax=Motilibacter peucedani TaxID=598650 RepID=A0A420XQD7_9ACTN|nr:hypothetical protein [Motilibacter peucedani]RKS75508.1 hypothetical protein CLV35_1978 [Motilibacter peucedani]
MVGSRGLGQPARTLSSVATCTALALGGHVLGGGPVAGPRAALLVALGPALFCTLVASARWTGPRLLVALAGAQATAHLLLAVAEPHDAMGSLLQMLAWHAVGTLLTAAALVHAELLADAVAGAVGSLAYAVRRPAPETVAGATGRCVPVASRGWVPRALLLTAGAPRRGPPAQPAR